MLKFVAIAVITATASKLVRGMRQGTPDAAGAPTGTGTADQWPPVPRREEG